MENKTPIKFIRNYIRGLSGIFSIPSPVSMTSFPAQTVICIHFATRHETNGERWIRDVIWSWHKILKWQENDNTKRKTLYDLKLFKKFLTSGNERRQIPAAELQHLLSFAIKLVLGVRNKMVNTLICNKKKITRWLKDMNFILSWLKTIFYSLSALVHKIFFSLTRK